MKRSCLQHTAALLVAAALLCWCNVAESFAADASYLKFDMGKAKAEGAEMKPIKEGAGPAMKIEVKTPKEGLAGVELPAAGGAWDLSKSRFVIAEVRNLGPKPVKIILRVENADSKRNVADGIEIDPRWGWTWTKVGLRRPVEQVKLDLFGMAEYPWGRPYQAGKSLVGRKDNWWYVLHLDRNARLDFPLCDAFPKEPTGVDPSAITKLSIGIDGPTGGCSFEVRNIRAAGAAPSAEMLADPAKFFPCIDEFGQYIHADWPGKTHEAADMKKSLAAETKDLEANPGPKDWDQYGGWKAGPALKATGFFRTEKYKGKWWLVDPEGRLFFSNGVSHVRATFETYWAYFSDDSESDHTMIQDRENWFRGIKGLQEEFKECATPFFCAGLSMPMPLTGPCFDFGWANAMRKYQRGVQEAGLRGNPAPTDWREDYALTAQKRLRSWGLNTIGPFSSDSVRNRRKTPYVVCLKTHHYAHGIMMYDSGGQPYGLFLDPYQDGFSGAITWMFSEVGLKPTANDPWCIGFAVDAEGQNLPNGLGDDEICIAIGTLWGGPDSPAKKVFIAELKAKYQDIAKLNEAWGTTHKSWEDLLAFKGAPDAKRASADLLAFQTKMYEDYFKACRAGVKAFAPNQLYLGYQGRYLNASVQKAAAKFCDVPDYIMHCSSPAGFKLPAGAEDKPFMIGQYGFSALDRGMLAGNVPDQQARAEAYRQFMNGALSNPQIVGCTWFKFIDFPATGRARDIGNCNCGFVDIADTPYPEMVQASREIGKTMYKTRMEAK